MKTKDSFLNDVQRYENPKLVKVSQQAIAELRIPRAEASAVPAGVPFQVSALSAPEAIDAVWFLMGLASMQYRFWSAEPGNPEMSRYLFEGKMGSSAMSRAWGRAWTNGGSQVNTGPAAALRACCQQPAKVLETFGHSLPDPVTRAYVLNEVLTEKARSVAEAILDGAVSTRKVHVGQACLVGRQLPIAFGDPFLKKAQLFLAFVAGWLREMGILVEIDLTAYADYQVPNVLRALNVLEYAPTLATAIDRGRWLTSGSPEECAIRAATVKACEEIARTHSVSAPQVDWWLFSQKDRVTTLFHRTPTTHY